MQRTSLTNIRVYTTQKFSRRRALKVFSMNSLIQKGFIFLQMVHRIFKVLAKLGGLCSNARAQILAVLAALGFAMLIFFAAPQK